MENYHLKILYITIFLIVNILCYTNISNHLQYKFNVVVENNKWFQFSGTGFHLTHKHGFHTRVLITTTLVISVVKSIVSAFMLFFIFFSLLSLIMMDDDHYSGTFLKRFYIIYLSVLAAHIVLVNFTYYILTI